MWVGGVGVGKGVGWVGREGGSVRVSWCVGGGCGGWRGGDRGLWWVGGAAGGCGGYGGQRVIGGGQEFVGGQDLVGRGGQGVVGCRVVLVRGSEVWLGESQSICVGCYYIEYIYTCNIEYYILYHVYGGRKVWICTIHGSVLCAGNPWIARTRIYVSIFICLYLFIYLLLFFNPCTCMACINQLAS